MNKTKIVVTIGPKSKNKEIIKDLILNGADVFRLNLNYADSSFCKEIVEKIKELNKELGKYTSIMFDISGPSVKVGKIESSHAFLKKDSIVNIYVDNIIGDSNKFSVNYNGFINDLNVGSLIKIANGLVEVKVIDKEIDYLICKVIKEGVIGDNDLVNVPTTRLNVNFLSKKDKEDIKLANELNIDYISLSFVSTIEDVLQINDLLIELENDHIGIISKIENEQAIDNIDDILSVSDGIMVARGELGVEIPLEKIPGIQKRIIKKCHDKGKISIVATEMISSMENSLTPTRAEVSDIANAVIDSCDAVMLSSETTIGKYPVETLEMMERIIHEAEISIDYDILDNKLGEDITSIIAQSVYYGANRVRAKAIITPTNTGYTAKKISMLRPYSNIIALSPNIDVIKSLGLYYGIIPILVKDFDSLDKMIKESKELAIKLLNLKENDKIIITGGYPFKEVKHTNFIKIEEL